jgi:hypothetical protein
MLEAAFEKMRTMLAGIPGRIPRLQEKAAGQDPNRKMDYGSPKS